MTDPTTVAGVAAILGAFLLLLAVAAIVDHSHHTRAHNNRVGGQASGVAAPAGTVTKLTASCSRQDCTSVGVGQVAGWWLCVDHLREVQARPVFDRDTADDFDQWSKEIGA